MQEKISFNADDGVLRLPTLGGGPCDGINISKLDSFRRPPRWGLTGRSDFLYLLHAAANKKPLRYPPVHIQSYLAKYWHRK
ncbi:hypothetical protein RHGRI_022866 [Rhododendron griersonianum]|uniref:Uncharacterized protein n=1 Tax=Rhododendron griersonianum TaxID=479676 RepID=A0AAV6J546_9ERIC|nr:hypothetical protein RHGRI_022866 [Rhododendron griersonianum]